MMSKDKVGVSRTIKEFAENYREMKRSKYIVEKSGNNIEITHVKYDKDYERWMIDESISIPFVTAKTMFGEMCWAIENDEIADDDDDEDWGDDDWDDDENLSEED